MMDVNSLNSDDRTRLSAPCLDCDEQSRHDNGHSEPYSSKEKSHRPQKWRALWPTQPDLVLTSPPSLVYPGLL